VLDRGPIGILDIDFIDQVDFLISGLSASYGDRLLSVVDIEFILQGKMSDGVYGIVSGPCLRPPPRFLILPMYVPSVLSPTTIGFAHS